jgi:hypothetical protein
MVFEIPQFSLLFGFRFIIFLTAPALLSIALLTLASFGNTLA